MGNMSYCRFENTLRDLEECFEALQDSSLYEVEENANEYEKPCIRALISQCKEIADEYGDED